MSNAVRMGWLRTELARMVSQYKCVVLVAVFFGFVASLHGEVVSLKGTDNANTSSMSGNGSSGWSDGTRGAVAGKDYRVADNLFLRSPTYTTDYAFQGDSLILDNGNISSKLGNNQILTIPVLVVRNANNVIYCADGNHNKKFSGTRWELTKDSVLKFGHDASDSRAAYLYAPLAGEGTLYPIVGTAANMDGRVFFYGDNRAFRGVVVADGLVAAGTAEGKKQVRICRPEAAFGDPASVNDKAFQLLNGMTLYVESDAEFGPNRGFYFGDDASKAKPRIWVEEGRRLVIWGPMSGSRGFVKVGKGELVVAGAVAEATKAAIEVAEGALCSRRTLLATDSWGTSSLNGSGSCAGWSADALVSGSATIKSPNSQAVYVIPSDRGLRTPNGNDSTLTYSFAGGCLAFDGGWISLKGKWKQVTVPHLTVLSSGTISSDEGGLGNSILSGETWTVPTGSGLIVRANESGIRVASSFVGKGTLQFDAAKADRVITLEGDNAAFSGSVAFLKNNAPVTVSVENGQAWFGDPETTETVKIAHGSTLRFKTSVQTARLYNFDFGQAGETCGCIEIAEGRTVVVQGAVFGANGFVKKGAGTLLLTGDVSGLDKEKVVVNGGRVMYGMDENGLVDCTPVACEVAYDGLPHRAALEVSYPQTGVSVSWAHKGETAYAFGTPELHREVGEYDDRYQVVAEGVRKSRGSVRVTIRPRELSDCSVVKIPAQAYTGAPIRPAVKVLVPNGVWLTEGVDYTVAYSNNTNPGLAEVLLTAKGKNVIGSRSVDFEIAQDVPVASRAGDDQGGQSAFTGLGLSATAWSNGRADAAAGANYETGYRLRTPLEGTSYTFAGETLRLLDGGSILYKMTYGGTVNVPLMTIAGGATVANGQGNYPCTFDGDLWTLESGAVLTCGVEADSYADTRKLTLAAPLAGSGKLVLTDGNVKHGPGAINLKGENGGFKGSLEVNNLSGNVDFIVDGPVAWPADPDGFQADAIRFNNRVKAVFNYDVDSGSKRGFTFENGVVLDVLSGRTVSLGGAISAANGFRKTGAGTLSLCGDSPLLTGSVFVESGTLLLAHPQALGAAHLTMGTRTALCLDVSQIGSDGVSVNRLDGAFDLVLTGDGRVAAKEVTLFSLPAGAEFDPANQIKSVRVAIGGRFVKNATVVSREREGRIYYAITLDRPAGLDIIIR
ncbi:MAG: hypothetical protein ACI4TC_07255 [Kiritimatiellia bacterium]